MKNGAKKGWGGHGIPGMVRLGERGSLFSAFTMVRQGWRSIVKRECAGDRCEEGRVAAAGMRRFSHKLGRP
jgi:hypothetical protein